jgi:hypothetical protein
MLEERFLQKYLFAKNSHVSMMLLRHPQHLSNHEVQVVYV